MTAAFRLPAVATVAAGMSISVVNGYLCTSCDDVAKAKKGENPHPPPGSETDGKDGVSRASEKSPFDGPSVTFGGSLSALPANAVAPVAAARAAAEVSQWTVTNAVDLLV